MLHAGSKHRLNVDGAFRHVMVDLMGSVGVVISGVVVILTDWVLIDPILSIGIALLIVVSSWRLVLKSVNVLLSGVPEHLDLYALCAELQRRNSASTMLLFSCVIRLTHALKTIT